MLRVFIYYFRIKGVKLEKHFKRASFRVNLPHMNTGKCTDQWRTEGKGVLGFNPLPQNSESPPKSYQIQLDCEKC